MLFSIMILILYTLFFIFFVVFLYILLIKISNLITLRRRQQMSSKRTTRWDVLAVYSLVAVISIGFLILVVKNTIMRSPCKEWFSAFYIYCQNMDIIQVITTALALLLLCKVLELEWKIREIIKIAKRMK